MRQVLTLVLLVTLAVSVLNGQTPPVDSGGESPDGTNTDSARTKTIERLLATRADQGLFNGVALVATEGEVLVRAAYGTANLEWAIPNSPETRFRLGSASKSFTAVMIMQLVQSGRLSLETTLVEVLEWYRLDVGKQVTIHHLLSHSSGIPFELPAGVFCDQRPEVPTMRELIVAYHSGDLEFEPGSAFKYSNSGYVILGAVIEQVTGMTFAKALDELIFKPSGMTHSGSETPGMIIPQRALGYQGTLSNRTAEMFFDVSFARGAGTIYSTLDDIHKWHKALQGNLLLSDASKELMFSPYLTSYGYGWEVHQLTDLEGQTMVRHTGDILGCHSLVLRVLEDNHLVVLLTKMDGAPLWELGDSLLTVLMEE